MNGGRWLGSGATVPTGHSCERGGGFFMQTCMQEGDGKERNVPRKMTPDCIANASRCVPSPRVLSPPLKNILIQGCAYVSLYPTGDAYMGGFLGQRGSLISCMHTYVHGALQAFHAAGGRACIHIHKRRRHAHRSQV